MPGSTAKGYPYALLGDANDLEVITKSMADKDDARPGVSPLTTAARDALTGVELWDGRIIWNTTLSTLQRYNAAGSAWLDAGGASAPLTLTASGAAVKPLTVKGAASQSVNLFEIQTSAGTVVGGVNQIGQAFFGATANNGGEMHLGAPAADRRPLVVRGAASQTANLAEFQNSSGTVLASIQSNGALNIFMTDASGLNGGTRHLQLGAADSAGAGYRTVRVAN